MYVAVYGVWGHHSSLFLLLAGGGCNIFRAYLPKIICHHGLQPLYSIGHIVVCALFATVSALSSMSGHLSDATFDVEAQMVSTLTA